MADTDLIAEYLTALRSSLSWRADVDDLVCEADDHLRCAAARLQRLGVDSAAAQRDVLVRFGDAKLIAHSFATTASGGTAMPTRLTRTAGTFALAAAIAWLAAAPAALVGAGSEDWEVQYAVLAIVAFLASACTTIALFGLMRRAGSIGALTVVAVTLATLGTLVLGIVTWAWLVGVTLLAVASAVTAREVHRRGVGTSTGALLLVAAWPIGVAVAVALDLMRVGPIDSYGEPYLGQLIGFACGAVIFAAGLFVSGRWLRREEAVDDSDVMARA
jgi:hypothetical protein